MFIRKYLFILFLAFSCNAFAGYLSLNTGIETQFKSYFRSEENSSKYYEGSQVDNLFLNTDYKRDFLRGRLGSLRLNLNLDQYNMNYFENVKPKVSFPFTSNSDAKNTEDFDYSLNGKLNFRIPKKNIELFVEYSDSKVLDVDSEKYFNSLPKIKADISELEGINTSLNNYNRNKMQNYYFYKYGKINFMANYTEYSYKKILETDSNYLTKEAHKKVGIDIKNLVGFNYKQEIKEFNLGEENSDKKIYTFGMVDSFGFPTLLKFKDLKIEGFGKITEEDYEGNKYNDRYYKVSTNITEGKHSVTGTYTYEYNEDKYINDINTTHNISGNYDYSSKDFDFYTNIIFTKENLKVTSIDEGIFSYNELNAILSNGIYGSGYILIKNTGSNTVTLDLSGVIIDGENSSLGIVLLNPVDTYLLNFNESIEGQLSIVTGDSNDLTLTVQRDAGYEYNKNKYEIRSGYYLKYFETIKSKLDIEYYKTEKDKVYDPSNRFKDEKESRFSLDKLFEIRPYNLIFDKEFRYERRDEYSSYTEKYHVISKDGYFTLNKKLYLESNYKKDRFGNSQDKVFYSFLLNMEKKDKNYKISFYPKKEYEKQKNIYKKNTTIYDLKIKYKYHNLMTYYKEEKTDYQGIITKVDREKRVNYQLNARNVLLDLKYRENDRDYKLQLYNANLKLIKYRSFPVVKPYAILELGFERERDNSIGEFKKDDYIIVKVSYTPTDRLTAIFAFEKQIDREKNKGLDYECAVSYKTRVFKMALGYRKNNTIMDGVRRVEHEVYFELRKNFGFYYGTRS
ncbi:hypothetical protein FHQ18_02975 [Deferribacter autotrophicus]|uniref:Uncharacterized protein n=1 Tax=Deferribacter autotrophicus TaxID=500465 RepID=A0A5A8F5X8_9BACT|nr:hypothetical protein [Deferribacter autotrophicus]KAA0258925.1 hypothetical protein FHQ18_02975 [Deferribacter autotrophicus]